VRTEVWDREPARSKHYEDLNEPYKVEAINSIPATTAAHVTARRLAGPLPWPDLPTHRPSPRDAFKLMSIGRALTGRRRQATARCCNGFKRRGFTAKKKAETRTEHCSRGRQTRHRKLGREDGPVPPQRQKRPGQIFWHPNGCHIYTELQDYMRRKQARRRLCLR